MAEKTQCELTSADIPGALQVIYREGIELWDVVPTGDLTVRFLVDQGNVSRLNSVLAHRGDRLRRIRRLGLSRKVLPWLRHPLLLAGIGLLLALTVWLPTRVFFIRVEGNYSVSTQRILEQAETCGIRFGCSRSEIRSEKMKNALLESMPMLQWAGINTSGCVATITVQERSISRENQADPVSGIIASRDGIIRSCTVHNGTALCSPGQAVREGQVLISGLTDCGLAILVTGAEGEVFAETSRNLRSATLENQWKRTEPMGQQKKISVLIGKKRINFYNDSGILDTSCVKMYSEYYITLPGGFSLPLGIGVETHLLWDSVDAETEDPTEMLEAYSRQYLLDHMSAGQILDERSVLMDGRLYTDYICLEMIGQNRYEEITIEHGKNDGENG